MPSGKSPGAIPLATREMVLDVLVLAPPSLPVGHEENARSSPILL
jgi:hypothetical protein